MEDTNIFDENIKQYLQNIKFHYKNLCNLYLYIHLRCWTKLASLKFFLWQSVHSKLEVPPSASTSRRRVYTYDTIHFRTWICEFAWLTCTRYEGGKNFKCEPRINVSSPTFYVHKTSNNGHRNPRSSLRKSLFFIKREIASTEMNFIPCMWNRCIKIQYLSSKHNRTEGAENLQ